jgi:hypothetical protein
MSAQHDKLNPDGSSQDGCLPSFIVIGIGLAIALLAWATPAAADDWDKSSVMLTGRCLLTGQAEFTVTNNGQDMTGPTAWREYELSSLTNSGTLQLAADASQTFTFGPAGSIEFQIDQRPGHPGSSQPKLTLYCTPTAVSISSFSARSGGNRGGCAPGNKIRGLAYTITDFTPGRVSGTCDGGFWFANVRTARTWRLDTPVTVQGCIGSGQRLTSAPGWALRISK